MSVSYELFTTIKDFDDLRREQRKQYLSKMASLSRFKGSEGYKRDKEEADRKRKETIDTARREAEKRVNELLRKMKYNANRVAIIPPTPEMVSILQILSMKSKISKSELDRAAAAMEGNSFALSALNDLADKHYFPGSNEGQGHPNFLTQATDLSGQATENFIRSLAKYCENILSSSAKQASLQAAKFNQREHGVEYNEDDLPQRGELVNERQFFGEIVPDSAYDAFMGAVNG